MTFQTARIKLTAVYLLIIMMITIMFSFVVWRILTLEVERGLRIQVLRTLPHPPPDVDDSGRLQFTLPKYHLQLLTEVKTRVAWWLFTADAVILVVSGFSGYFLAGRTLKPIEEMMEEQKRFVADASHELRTPLTAMKTETEVALRDKKMSLNQARSFLKSNLEEVDKLKSLTDFFLSLSRFQDPTIRPDFTKIDLQQITEKVLTNLNPLAKKKNIKIKKNVGNVFFKADASGISQLLTIIIDNAIKYSNKNGKIEVGGAIKNNHVIIRVADTGIGIKPESLPHIFDRFFRADSSRNKNKVDGYGLGLSIAKSIVAQHNANIDVKSEFGKGTTFIVSLPI